MPRELRDYLSARETKAPTVAPDGRLAFLADTTGTMQVWTSEEPDTWPTQRTFYEDRISIADWSPDGGAIAFGKDSGADEHDQLFALDPETNEISRLTDRPDAIHLWGGWSPAGDRIAFTANRRDSAAFDVYVMAVDGIEPGATDADEETAADGPEPRLVCEGEGFYSVDDWSPDGERLLVSTANASSDTDLFVVDVETGEREHVTPHDGDVRYTHATFGPNDDVYCLSDANADTMELVRIDEAGGDVTTVVGSDDDILDAAAAGDAALPDDDTVTASAHDRDWSIDGFALDADSGRLVYTWNVEGYSVTAAGRLASATDVAAVPVDHPAGVVSELTIGADGERAAMTVSATNLNYSIFGIDLADGGVAGPEATRWTTPSPGGVTLDRYHEPELIRYETFDVDGRRASARETESRVGREIPAFVTLPDDYEPGETPVIVDIHGGPSAQRRPSWRNRPIRQYFLDAGYALFEPNVRGSTGYGATYAALDDVEKRMDSVRDIDAAVEWLADHPAIDSDRIVCYGRSYGGFMVLSCITEYPDHWAAAVDFVGIANWVTFLENTGDYRRSHREAEYGSLAEDREFLESISPIHAVDRIECPLFVQHGENDPRVPVDEARQIADAVESQGIPVETCIFDDEGHHTTSRENRIEQFERIVDFLDEHV
ncbi:dipeptidyl aminopeptidase/acylaminoacyl peptidase [Halovivax ruber XH-70]|uniref:Acyl-peptide hydrolase n=1 Tax=Halovivax ruber (strain DSM 18193 / JCM 13892 / XH-70) TaxID=797302 RepID=L0I9W0_HALRX|nr:S9 family peptidase [Halovivax ruber]AGB15509.1 dipeptidyl aminopeptidase/acylaminoacyl peptidase [Halovivax ruber XH-70]